MDPYSGFPDSFDRKLALSNGSKDRTPALWGILADKYPQLEFFHIKGKDVG